MPVIHDDGEDRCQADPQAAPQQRLAKFNRVRAPMEDNQVQSQHREDKDVEQNPEEDQMAAWQMMSAAK